jgi:hypothetical protein
MNKNTMQRQKSIRDEIRQARGKADRKARHARATKKSFIATL